MTENEFVVTPTHSTDTTIHYRLAIKVDGEWQIVPQVERQHLWDLVNMILIDAELASDIFTKINGYGITVRSSAGTITLPQAQARRLAAAISDRLMP